MDQLAAAGAIDAETHGRALSQAYAEMDRSAQQALATSREWHDGMSRALQDYAARATGAAAAAGEPFALAWHQGGVVGRDAAPQRAVVSIITDFAPVWDELFPAEQARIVRLLVEHVDLGLDGMRVNLPAEGLQTLVAELTTRRAA